MNNALSPRADYALFFGVGTCFTLSGFAALLYQTAWMRQLATVFGTSELAVATVLAAYMAGLALGAALAAGFVDRIRRPILFYGVLEAAIAISALAVPFLLELAGFAYAAIFGGQPEPPDASGAGQSLFYLIGTLVILAIPTACMGATLPLLTRYAVRSNEQVGPRTGALYALNTAGAIGGTLAAALVLLPAFGLMGTIVFGAGINLLVFVLAVGLSRASSSQPAAKPQRSISHAGLGKAPEAWILPAMLVSGFATFTYEVLWTRLLSHILGGSLVAFATMLASFLLGIALGSAIASRIANTRTVSQTAFVISQILIAIVSLLVYRQIDSFIPDVTGLGGNIIVAIAMLLPATLFIGATFPLAVRILSRNESDAANASARVYSWNTVGAIAGALVAGFVLIPILRYEGAIKLAVCINAALALYVALLVPTRRVRLAVVSACVLLLVAVGFRPESPESLLRVSPLNDYRSGEIRYYDVGRSATVLMLERDGFFYLRTNGLPEASTDMIGAPPSRHTQRTLAALPIIAKPDAEQMLVIGLGGGVVAEDIPSSVRAIDIIELEPKVVEANRAIAAERNIDPLADSRVNIAINDARNALRLSDKQYDAVISQPSHPWTAGASHLYTREFMQLVRSRLSSNGVFLQWMNMRFISEALLSSLSATLLDVFPYVRAYHFDPNIIFFLASPAPIEPEMRLAESGEPLVSHGTQFRRKGIASINDVVAALAWDEEGLRAIAGSAPVISDNDNLIALRSGGLAGGRSLTYSSLKGLIREHGPLFDAQSAIHQQLADRINFVYVADRLATLYAPELMIALVNALRSNGNPTAMTIDGRVARQQEESQRADQLLLAALAQDPRDPTASYLLLRDRGRSLAEGTLPMRIAPYADNLPLSARTVLINLDDVRQGQVAAARQYDATLADIPPDALWYLDAAMMRASWRIGALTDAQAAPLAEEAMQIIDDAIAVHQDLDLYGMRMVASFLSENYNATLETARRMVWSIRSDIDFRSRSTDVSITRRELQSEELRLQSMRAGLEEVREIEALPAYKLRDLDMQIQDLLLTIQRLADSAPGE